MRLKALGGLALSCERGALRGAATQRRRLTLLATIAIAGKKGISRDRLLTLLWAESDEAQGRHALAQSLYALRRDLQADDLFLGTTELRLNPDVIHSDVEDFREALAAGDVDRAVLLYQGPLLDGVYISNAPDFEKWLDSERDSLARGFSEALEALAARQEKQGDIAAASASLTRLAASDPLNKRVVIKAMQSLVVAGDVAGALTHATRHESQRRDDLDMPGDVEVLALRDLIARRERELLQPEAAEEPVADALRERLPGNPAQTSVSNNFSEAPTAPLGVSPVPAKKRFRKRVASHWVGVAAAVALIALGIRWGVVSAGTGKSVTTRVAVLPFTVRGSPRLNYLSDGMVDLLSQRLDGVGALHTVDPNALLEFIRSDSGDKPELSVGKAAAQHFNAGQFIVGSVVDAGGSIQISATAYDAKGRRLAVANASAADESHVLSLVDDLARGLVGGELMTSEARLGREAARTTPSLSALKAFLQGEQEFRAAHFSAAVESYERAVAADSTFALAWYRLSTAAEWASQSDVVSNATRAAVRFEARLPLEERMLLDARMAALRGDDDEVERLYHSILADHPEDAEAWTQLGETIFHNGGWRGRPMGESRAAFERAALLHSSDVNSRLHLARLAALRNDRRALDSLIPPTISRAKDTDQLLELGVLNALAVTDREKAENLLDSLEKMPATIAPPEQSIRLAAWRAATYATDPRSAQRLALMLARSGNSPATRLSGLLAAAHMSAAQGKWRQGKTFLDMADRIDRAASIQTRANLALSGIVPVGHDELRLILDQVRSLSPAQVPGLRLARASLTGHLAIALRDSAILRKSNEAIVAALRADTSLSQLAQHLSHQLDAREALALGNSREALSVIESGWPKTNPQAIYPWLQSEAYTMASGRFLLARLLDDAGRTAEALPWYETIAEDQGFSTVYLAPSYLRRAVAEERLGRKIDAAEHYGRFISLWGDADAPLQPQVRFARSRLAAIARQK